MDKKEIYEKEREYLVPCVAHYYKEPLILDRGKIRYDGAPARVYRHVSILKNLGLNVPAEAELGALFAR